mmetsp:Transcript_64343/g.172207  ORF Transcript_64343/g.172207 Transcript_64343/m.172207 type:complete len:106 (+) Transcript_64343:736-1053(+)
MLATLSAAADMVEGLCRGCEGCGWWCGAQAPVLGAEGESAPLLGVGPLLAGPSALLAAMLVRGRVRPGMQRESEGSAFVRHGGRSASSRPAALEEMKRLVQRLLH